MSLVTFSFPTPALFGAGALKEIASRSSSLGISRPLVVTDAGVFGGAAFAAIRAALGAADEGVKWFCYWGVHSNPVENDVREAAAVFGKNDCDGVIAVGGGSPLDVGKAARLLVKRPGFDLANFYQQPDWTGLAPFIAIPTTAGTGSEVGRSSVITLEQTRRKSVIFHPQLLAALVILDPELTRGLPAKLTAATGADALTHCIESYTCPTFHPMCDGIALEGVRLIVDALPRAYKNGGDLDARGKMLVAAAMGAVAFQKDLGVVHSLAHPLSTVCGLHHGLANALCLVAGMKFCAARKPGIYRRIGIACELDLIGCPEAEADERTIEFIGRFLKSVGLSGRLREHGADPGQIETLAAQAFEDPCHKTNAAPVTKDDIRQLYAEVL